MFLVYLDEDAMRHALIRALQPEFDIQTPVDTNARGRSDLEQLSLAASLGRVLYTFNARDFSRIHASWVDEGRPHAGIVVVNDQRLPVAEQARRLRRMAAVVDADGMRNRLEFLGAWR